MCVAVAVLLVVSWCVIEVWCYGALFILNLVDLTELCAWLLYISRSSEPQPHMSTHMAAS